MKNTTSGALQSSPLYSVVIPVYKNVSSIPEVLKRIERLNKTFLNQVEAIFIVDGSPDSSLLTLKNSLPKAKFSSRLVSHSRNFGSFAAIRTGLSLAEGRYLAIMSADLQEPAELIVDFFKELATGRSDVVLGVRSKRNDDFLSQLNSNSFWWMYRKFVQPETPKGGVDIFGITKSVATTLVTMSESHSSLVGQLMWIGFRRSEVLYVRQARKYGKSAWSFAKKLTYFNDSLYSFTSFPISIILVVGALGTATSGAFALVVFSTWVLGGIGVPGYTAQMIVQLLSTGSVLLALGVLGTYIWRTYENSKQRPQSIVMSDEKFFVQ